MHTARSLTVSPSMLCSGGGCLVRGGVPGPGGVWSWGVGMPGPGRGVLSQHELRQIPLWTEFLTHASENITLLQTSFAGGKNHRIYTLFYRVCKLGST